LWFSSIVLIPTRYLHPGFDGLPSWRPSSLCVLALLAFHNVEFSRVYTSNDCMSRTGELPVLKTRLHALCNFRDLSRGLTSLVLPEGRAHCDARLTADELGQLCAYDVLCHGPLNSLLMRTWWLMDRNRESVVEPRTIGHLPWIVRSRTSISFVRHLANVQQPRRPLLMEAQDVFSCLDSKLGDAPYLFGALPTSVDAAAFGYLCAVLYTPLPDPVLSLLLQERFPRLVRFVQRVLSTHLSVDTAALELPAERPAARPSRLQMVQGYLPGLASNLFRVVLAVGFGYIFVQAWQAAKTTES
jgi:hypothetical protein